MADRKNFYFRQKVTEGELDSSMDELEAAIRRLSQDLGLVGVAYGCAVTQQVVPNLTVLVTGPGAAYNQLGERMAVPSTQTLNCALDENGITTAVTTPGNSKILSVFLEFDRALSDPRLDGNAVTVFFERDETFVLNVVQGAESGSPVAPALRSDQILLADITIAFGATTIVNANISTTRRQWMFKTTTGTPVATGTAEEAIQALADALSTDGAALAAHLANTVDAHDASAISFVPGGTVASTDVQAAIAEVAAEKLALAGGTMTGSIAMGTNNITNAGTVTANGVVSGSSFDFVGGSVSRVRSIPLVPHVVEGSGWIPDAANQGEWITDGAIFNQKIWFDILPFLPHGCEFQSLTVVWEQTGGFGTGSDQMRAQLWRHQMNFTTLATTLTDPVGFALLYGTGTGLKSVNINPTDFTIDRETTTASDTALWLEIDAAAGGVSRVAALRLTYREPGPRNN